MDHDRNHCRGQAAQGSGPSSFWLQNPAPLFAAMALEKGMVFVDAGCGAGEYSLHAAKILGSEGRIFALDARSRSVDWLNSRQPNTGEAPITGLVCDITESLPLAAGQADVVMLGTVLHIRSVRDKADRLFSEIRRILRPEGMLAVLECKKEEADFGPPLLARLSPEDVAAVAGPQGFRMVSELLQPYTYLACFRPC
ncbi:methyltransferase domain-containing protein [Pseudodesulfovibrio sp. F-1]|uniref:Methyltransferase domain-containing protein n=1 Tax=Pseudodesulfovibrio alkaliphilus TaxID=2661613 RepID=A0A7K1KRF6_9BACT|nr:class I SAM-dependent methyltransferase [Pseudodesulfovibrio alkaliphilus]MUM78502.1 methyltransferase domain-containing protein [Pseudodesulfovibrio alkaliphilus]